MTTIYLVGFVLLVFVLARSLAQWERSHGWGPGWSRGKIVVTVLAVGSAIGVLAQGASDTLLFWTAAIVAATLVAHAFGSALRRAH